MRFFVQVHPQNFFGIIGEKWWRADQQFKERHAETVNVAARIIV